MLKAVGVDAVGDMVYRVLVEVGPASDGELADRVRVGREEVAVATATLASLDLVERGSDGRWQAVSPMVALGSLIDGAWQDLEARQAELERLRVEAAELLGELRRRQARGQAAVEVVADPREARRRCGQIVRRAATEILYVEGPVPYLVPEHARWDPAYDDVSHQLLGRGVRLRTLYSHDRLHLPGGLESVQRLIAAGEEARTLPEVPTELIVCDRRHAIVPLDPSRYIGAIFVAQSGMLTALIALFESLWLRAAPVQAPPAADEPGDLDATLLRLLAAGLTDEAIARHLRVSQSTVTRRIAKLLLALDASSRFQAGAQAARRGEI